MVSKILKSVILILITSTLLSFDLPAGWFKAGSNPKSYDMGIDKFSGQDGNNAATIKSIDKKIDGFGTLMQNFKPDKYLGKKIRMSGFMKTKDVISWASFWLRVDQADSKNSLSFDNMNDRSIKGTTSWKKYEIVLAVPDKASNIAIGALLDGTGQIWFDEINFDVVDNSVPSTGQDTAEPKNLNFDK